MKRIGLEGGESPLFSWVDTLHNMASNRANVDYIVSQMAGAGVVTARPMFGEYGIYCDGKIVALFCDDQLFVKPTAAGRSHCGPCPEAPPYPGAKPQLLIAEDRWDDKLWLSTLIRITAAELPMPKPKTKKPKG
jgi:TfoX/Sxy family transcriptional regulator of competence genes